MQILKFLPKFFIFIILFANAFFVNGQVKIGDNPTSVNPLSLLELESTTKGLLLPRMNITQIKAMTNVPKGMLVFNSTDSALYLKRDTGWAILSFATGATSVTNKWATNGTHISNTNTGNVGIGTGTDIPYSKLTVRANAIGLTQESSSGAVKVGFYTNDANAWIQTHSNHNLSFATGNGATTMTLSTAGKLGIGTVTPAEALDVNGNIKYTGNLMMGVQYITYYTDIPGNSYGSVTCNCPGGTKLIGGGGGHRDQNSAAQDIKLNYSGPDLNNTNNWKIMIENTSGSSRALVVFAICAKVQ